MANTKISALSAATALAGTEVVPVVQGGATVKATANQLKTFMGLGGPFFNAQSYGWLPDGTDRSTEALALLTTVSTAGGGTIYFPPSTGKYRADSQLFIPNNGDTDPNELTQVNIRFTGAGGGSNWGSMSRTDVGASVLDLRYTAVDGNAKIESRGAGALVIDYLTLVDGASANATPFVHVTNTTLTVRDSTFIGSGSATQDAIVLGGASNTTAGSGVTAPFQGYGTVISANHFRKLNRMVYGRTYSNSVVVTNNAYLFPSGTRAIEFAATTGNPPDIVTGVYGVGNTIEMSDAMVYGVVLQAVSSSYFANTFNDAGGSYVSDYRLVAGSNPGAVCQKNVFIDLLSGGVRVSQSGGAEQFTLNTFIGAGGDTNLTGDGISSSSFAKGMEVTGSWTVANAAAGALNIRDEFNPSFLLCLAASLNDGTSFIDSYSNAGFNRALTIQPRGGPTTFGGPFAHKPTSLTVANGLNSNKDLWNIDATAKSSFIRLTGPTGAFSIGGFVNKSSGTDSYPGSVLHLYNTTSQAMTIVNEDASSTAGNRIKTLTGANVVLRSGTSFVTLIYDSTDSRWILASSN